MGNRDVFLRHDFCICSIRRRSRGQKVVGSSRLAMYQRVGRRGQLTQLRASKTQKRISGRPQPRPVYRRSWPDLHRALHVKCSCRFCLSLRIENINRYAQATAYLRLENINRYAQATAYLRLENINRYAQATLYLRLENINRYAQATSYLKSGAGRVHTQYHGTRPQRV